MNSTRTGNASQNRASALALFSEPCALPLGRPWRLPPYSIMRRRGLGSIGGFIVLGLLQTRHHLLNRSGEIIDLPPLLRHGVVQFLDRPVLIGDTCLKQVDSRVKGFDVHSLASAASQPNGIRAMDPPRLASVMLYPGAVP